MCWKLGIRVFFKQLCVLFNFLNPLSFPFLGYCYVDFLKGPQTAFHGCGKTTSHPHAWLLQSPLEEKASIFSPGPTAKQGKCVFPWPSTKSLSSSCPALSLKTSTASIAAIFAVSSVVGMLPAPSHQPSPFSHTLCIGCMSGSSRVMNRDTAPAATKHRHSYKRATCQRLWEGDHGEEVF